MAGRYKQLSRRRQKPTRDSIPNRESSIALAHVYAAIIACTVLLSDVLWSLQIHGAWLRFAVVAMQACFTSSLPCAHRLLLPSYLIRAPVAGFIGLLLLVLLRGIRLLRQETSIRARLICLLQVFGFLGFYVLDLFSSASSSRVLICVFVFCGFVLHFLVPSKVSVSFSVSS